MCGMCMCEGGLAFACRIFSMMMRVRLRVRRSHSRLIAADGSQSVAPPVQPVTDVPTVVGGKLRANRRPDEAASAALEAASAATALAAAEGAAGEGGDG